MKIDESQEQRRTECFPRDRAGHGRYLKSIVRLRASCARFLVQASDGILKSRLKAGLSGTTKARSNRAPIVAAKSLLLLAGLIAPILQSGFGAVYAQSDAAQSSLSSGPAVSTELPKFEVASIKSSSDTGRRMLFFTPGGLAIRGLPIQSILRQAFGIESERIIGLPEWGKTNRYDIEAKVAPEDADKVDNLSAAQRDQMLVALLVERFHLRFHHETRELPVFSLVRAKGELKLSKSKSETSDTASTSPLGGTPPKGIETRGNMTIASGHIESQDTTLDMLAHALSMQLGRPVVDATGLTGRYDFTLQWTPDNAAPSNPVGPGGPTRDDSGIDAGEASLYTALQEQLGLKLEASKGRVDVIVVDYLTPPSEN
jgi:uncharacterized protein (TIGR03435 family)